MKFDITKGCKEDFFVNEKHDSNSVCNNCFEIVGGETKPKRLYYARSSDGVLTICETCYNSLLDKKPEPFKIKVGMTLKEVQDNYDIKNNSSVGVCGFDSNFLYEAKDIFSYTTQYTRFFDSDNLNKKVKKIRGINKNGSLVLEVE